MKKKFKKQKIIDCNRAHRDKKPLVTIGIPTYNGEKTLRRALDSVAAQTYTNLEITISDNASTDNTKSICSKYASRDARISYTRQIKNIGITSNFEYLKQKAQGEYFMWLSDDDWLDHDYISSCLDQFESDPNLILVSGSPLYYRNGVMAYSGRSLDLTHPNPFVRVILYYLLVSDNGIFYGLMRLDNIRGISFKNTLAGDWLWIANVVFLGTAKMLGRTSIHRELGGTSVSIHKIVETLSLPKVWKKFPRICLALEAGKDIRNNEVYSLMGCFQRTLLFFCVSVILLIRFVVIGNVLMMLSRLKRNLP